MHRLDLSPQLLDLVDQLGLLICRVFKIKARVMWCNEWEVGRYGEDITQRPCFKEVERDIHMGVEKRLECDKALFDLLRAIPVPIHLLLPF